MGSGVGGVLGVLLAHLTDLRSQMFLKGCGWEHCFAHGIGRVIERSRGRGDDDRKSSSCPVTGQSLGKLLSTKLQHTLQRFCLKLNTPRHCCSTESALPTQSAAHSWWLKNSCAS